MQSSDDPATLFLTRITNGVFVMHQHYMVQITKNEAITSKTYLLIGSNILEPKTRSDSSHLLYIMQLVGKDIPRVPMEIMILLNVKEKYVRYI